MSVTDILTRANALCKKYEKYDLDKKVDKEVHKNDRFLHEYMELEADIQATIQKSNDASIEKNRAIIATLNAEIRRAKVTMRARLPKLEKYSLKQVKGIKPEDIALRPSMVAAIISKIEEIPDGVITQSKLKGKGLLSKSMDLEQQINIDWMKPDNITAIGDSKKSEESQKFSEEVEKRRTKQDENMDLISEGLTTLGNMAQDINEELDKQTPLVDEIVTKVDKAQSELKNNNTRLKDTLLKMRSTRNFAMDITLLCIVLGIGAALYTVIKAKLKK